MIRLRREDECATCRAALTASTRAWWDPESRSITCLACGAPQAARGPDATGPPTLADALEVGTNTLDAGRAGASAQREFERRHQRRIAELERKWGSLAGVAKFLSSDPQSTRAWATGSSGERQLAESLAKRVGDRAVLLHDRKIPRTRGNIDHLAIAASGVWVIDAKKYQGQVERRDKGGFFSIDYHLYVGGHDKTKLVEGLKWQVEAVRSALGGLATPIQSALCFIDAEWRLFAKPFELNGVWVTWGKELANMIAAPGPIGDAQVLQIADRLATNLPASRGAG